MNKLFSNIWKGAVLALLSGALWSCDDPNQVPVDLTFDLDTKEVTIPSEGGQGTIALDAPVAWKAESRADWLVIEPASGEAGKVTITLKAAENESGDARSTTVTISAVEVALSATVTVKQPKKDVVVPPDNKPEALPDINYSIADWTGSGKAAFSLFSDGGEEPGTNAPEMFALVVVDIESLDKEEEDPQYETYPMTEVSEGVFRATVNNYYIGLIMYVISSRQLEYGQPAAYFPVLTGEMELPANPANPYFLAFLNQGTLQFDFLPGERVFKVKMI